MNKEIEKQAREFFAAENFDKNSEYYCKTRDIFQARLDKMIIYLLKEQLKEEDAYILSAIAGEIGNNSFDHNLGSWVGEIGIFFAYGKVNNVLTIVLADAGQGVYKTLKKVKPELKNDIEALRTAFNEKISGRAPESRGNGLKFVKANIKDRGMHLDFYSGSAKAELNYAEKIEAVNGSYQGCLAIISLKKI